MAEEGRRKCRVFIQKLSLRFFLILLILSAMDHAKAQGMMGDGMVGRDKHREMMQRMMGGMLPQPIDPAELPKPESKGAKLLQRFCTQCHYLYGPGLYTAKEWPSVVERMNRRMQMMAGRNMMMGRIEAPSPEQLATITAYLQENAQKAIPGARVKKLQQTEGGRLFSTVCSRCHALPDPAQHTAGEWPPIVKRMKRYMTEPGQDLPTDKEWEQIINYLQRNSGAGLGNDRQDGTVKRSPPP